MSEELNNLELEVEAMLAPLADKFAVVPGEAAVLRVRAAVRHEVNEAWLGRQLSPEIPAQAVARVRGAVREQLRSRRAASAQPTWSRSWSAVAAAAMILLAVGVIHRAGTLKPQSPDAMADPQLTRFIAAAETIWADDPLTASIVADLDAVEASITQWQPIDESETSTLNELMNEIDSLLAEPESGKDISRRVGVQQGVYG